MFFFKCYFNDIKDEIEEKKRKSIHDELIKLKSKFEPLNNSHLAFESFCPSSKQNYVKNPVVLLNKCLNNERIEKCVENKTTETEICEHQTTKKSEYEIRILETDAEGSQEVELVEVERTEFDTQVLHEEVFFEQNHEVISEQMQSKENLRSSISTLCEGQKSETYFKIIENSEHQTLDKNGEKKIFACVYQDCNESFARRQMCKTHYFNHFATNSNYCCKHCSKKFRVQSALERHERIHSNSKVSCYFILLLYLCFKNRCNMN